MTEGDRGRVTEVTEVGGTADAGHEVSRELASILDREQLLERVA